jgi:hypothetical protein
LANRAITGDYQRRMLAIGGSVMIGAFALPHAARLWWSFPPTGIQSCETQWSHGPRKYAHLDDGRLEDVTELAACPPLATTLEKRRGEVHFRINGQYHAASLWDFWPGAAFVFLGAILIGLRIVLPREQPTAVPITPVLQSEKITSDVCETAPRPLPEWARSKHWLTAAFAILIAVSAASFAVVGDYVGMIVLCLVALAVAGIVIAVRSAQRQLLRHGTAAAARVTDVVHSRGVVYVSYEFETTAGRKVGTTRVAQEALVRRYGSWPAVGDPAVVVHRKGSATLWSLSPLPPQLPRPAPALIRIVPLVIFGALAVVILVDIFLRKP